MDIDPVHRPGNWMRTRPLHLSAGSIPGPNFQNFQKPQPVLLDLCHLRLNFEGVLNSEFKSLRMETALVLPDCELA